MNYLMKMRGVIKKWSTVFLFLGFVSTMFITPAFLMAQTDGTVSGPGAVAGQEGTVSGPGAVRPTSQPITVGIKNPFKGGSDLYSIINSILHNIIIPLGSVVVVLVIIYSGFKYVMAQGNATKITEANKALQGALIGAAILLGAEGISIVITNTICHQLFTCGS